MWILAAPAHPEFMHALSVLKQTKIMEAVQIKVEKDRATMSKAAKDIRDALKAGRSGGRSSSGQRGAERSEQGRRARQKFGCAPRQKVWRKSLVRVLRGEPHHGQVRSPQRSSSPWPGRCKLGFSHHLQSIRCLSGTCKQSAVGGTLARNWWVAAACNSHTVQLLSGLHVGGSVF